MDKFNLLNLYPSPTLVASGWRAAETRQPKADVTAVEG